MTFDAETDLSALLFEVPPLKYNKSLLVLLTQDDCKQAAFSTTWAAIHGRPLSDTYYYCANQLRGGDLPPDCYGFGKSLGSTDGTGHEVRFSFATTVSPEWEYMADTAKVQPGYTANYYRFFMKSGLTWPDLGEMLNYGVGIAMHNVKTEAENLPDSIRTHFSIAQQLLQDRLSGRGSKLLAEPDGNKNYVTAAQGYDPLQFILLQTPGVRICPFALDDDLLKTPVTRDFRNPEACMAEIQSQLQQPLATREAVNIGVHGTARDWSEFLLWLNNTYGKDGADCVWMPSPEEFFEYNYLRRHVTITQRIEGNKLHIKVDMPGLPNFYYPSLSLNIRGVDPQRCSSIEGGASVTGLTWGKLEGQQGVLVNFDCRHALVELATHFVELYESTSSAANLADARYFVAMLKESAQKTALEKRLK